MKPAHGLIRSFYFALLGIAYTDSTLVGLNTTFYAVTVSIGWAAWEGEAPDELLRRADFALYDAKRAGRDRVEGAPATVHRRI